MLVQGVIGFINLIFCMQVDRGSRGSRTFEKLNRFTARLEAPSVKVHQERSINRNMALMLFSGGIAFSAPTTSIVHSVHGRAGVPCMMPASKGPFKLPEAPAKYYMPNVEHD